MKPTVAREDIIKNNNNKKIKGVGEREDTIEVGKWKRIGTRIWYRKVKMGKIRAGKKKRVECDGYECHIILLIFLILKFFFS